MTFHPCCWPSACSPIWYSAKECVRHTWGCVQAAGKAPPPANEAVDVNVDVFKQAVPGVALIRCWTAGRLKYEVEYGTKRGTSDNCYLLRPAQVRPAAAASFLAYAMHAAVSLLACQPRARMCGAWSQMQQCACWQALHLDHTAWTEMPLHS